MIAYLQGQIIARDEQSIVLNVNGVGYQVFLSEHDLQALPPENGEQTFYIYQHIREDANTLFGFTNWQGRKLFVALLSVSGIGPKMAMSILAKHSAAELVGIIYRGDATGLSIGKKTAEKVILELKDKIAKIFPDLLMNKNDRVLSPVSAIRSGDFFTEIKAALTALGYTTREIEELLHRHQIALAESDSVEKAITYLLKQL